MANSERAPLLQPRLGVGAARACPKHSHGVQSHSVLPGSVTPKDTNGGIGGGRSLLYGRDFMTKNPGLYCVASATASVINLYFPHIAINDIC